LNGIRSAKVSILVMIIAHFAPGGPIHASGAS
jgi:hypothetical protein